MLHVNEKKLEHLLAVNGYFVIPFIDDKTIEQLLLLYTNHFSSDTSPFYSTSFHENIDTKNHVNDSVLQLLNEHIAAQFSDYKILGTSFLKKSAKDNNLLPLHQDWTVTDEIKYGSFTIWIALQDTDKHNGAIRVIPQSHLLENNFRAPSIPVSFEADREVLEKFLITVSMRKGEAFVFNQKLMHASWPNSSTQNRMALTIGLVPKEADLFMLYYNKNKKTLSKYTMPEDLFLHYPEIIEQPKIGTLTSTSSYNPKLFSLQNFLENSFLNRQKYSCMQPLFTNTEHQHFFEENGYIKLPALDNNAIKELTDFLYTSGIKKITDYGFYVGMDHENKQLVENMMQKIEAVAMPFISSYLKDYQLITASYVIKDFNEKGVVPPHQDWTFVEDETQHCSVTCWIPLVDTTMENGCLGIIKGSHKFLSNVRPSPSPQVPSPLAQHMFSLFPYFDLIPMKAGEAIIFDNRTFHASPPNIAKEPRLAIGLSFTQKDAKLCHYMLKPGTKDVMLKYKVSPDFFKRYDNGTLSKMYDAGKTISDFELVEEVPYTWENLSKNAMKQRVLSAGNKYNKELTTHMLKLFGSQMKGSFKENIKNILYLPIQLLYNVKARF